MRILTVLFLTIFLAVSCKTAPDPAIQVQGTANLERVEQVQLDAGVDAGMTKAPNFENVVGYGSIPWGSARNSDFWDLNQFNSSGIIAKSYDLTNGDQIIVARGPTSDPLASVLVMSWGFNKGRLAYGTMLYPVAESLVPTVCQLTAEWAYIEYGEPHANQGGSVLIWQNPNTTIMMFCTNRGPVTDWYSTLWLREHKGFIAHRAIPQEALDGKTGKDSTQ